MKLTRPYKLKFNRFGRSFQIQAYYRKPFGGKNILNYNAGEQAGKKGWLLSNPFRHPGSLKKKEEK